jgi:hypothetical protein
MQHTREYDNLCNSFQEFFSWVEEKVFASFLLSIVDSNIPLQLRNRLPDVYDELSLFTDVLPGKEGSPVHPFGGFVLNINVITRCHRDVKDLSVCLVLVIGDHVGGELCLLEPGLVLRLRNGDMALFPSGHVTHFNLHYKGIRASLVLHSDRAGKAWADNRNGWIGHNYMS